MATLLLHAGMSKAGSTAIQDFMVAASASLSAAGVSYFPVLKAPNHTALAAAFCRHRARVFAAVGVNSESDRQQWQRGLAKRLARTVRPDSHWVASTEHLTSQLTTQAEIDECAQFLGSYFDEITVVLVLRRADYWLPSAYPESIQAGKTYSFDRDYVEFRRRYLKHRALAKRWQSAFGSGRVVCIPYLESDKKTLHALPDRLLRAGDLTEPGRSVGPSLRTPSNPALGARATEVLRTFNPLLATSAWRPATARGRAVAAIAAAWPGEPVRLTPEAWAAVGDLGLSVTRIAESSFAVGGGWDEWVAQPPAPQEPQVVLTGEERTAAYEMLLRDGFLRVEDVETDDSAEVPLLVRSARKLWRR